MFTVTVLVSGCCQFELFVHVPVGQTHRAVQATEPASGFQLERHAWTCFTWSFLPDEEEESEACRLLIQQLEQNRLIGPNQV